MKKFNNLFYLSALFAVFTLASCEGPMGPAGKDGTNGIDGTNGTNGTNGADGSAACKLCHNPAKVDLLSVQYEFSKHSYGEAAFEESGNTGCSPCHAQEAFKYVCANNTLATFSLSGTTYVNNYAAAATNAYGEIGCSTCHSSLHATGTSVDLPALTTTAAVKMTMWGGLKEINLTHDGGKANLCVKCHQPRPFTRSFGDKNVIDYAALVSAPTTTFFDGAAPTATTNVNTIRPSYRTHTHYGTAGAVYAGVGGVEFGTGYVNSYHTANATCQDCHMAAVTGRVGGHTFFAKGNFNGCNVTGCHTPAITSTNTTYWTTPRNEIHGLLNQLAAKLTIGGVCVLNINKNTTEGALLMVDGAPVTLGVNLWASATDNAYDGYLNIYDPLTNPSGTYYNQVGGVVKMFRNPNPGTLASGWSQAQIDYNLTLPILVLTNAQMGAIINFQLCLRDYSLGIHNLKYTRILLTNSIAAIPAAS